MKSNDFWQLCDNACSKEVRLLCFVKFVALVFLFRCWKNRETNDTKKLDSGVSILSSNNESEVSAKKRPGSGEKSLLSFFMKNLMVSTMLLLVSEQLFFMAVPAWAIRVCHVCFLFHPDIKIWFPEKNF